MRMLPPSSFGMPVETRASSGFREHLRTGEGGFPHRYTAREVIPSHGFRQETSPARLPTGNRQTLARPRGKGAIQRERFSDDTQETGAGDVPSLLPGEPHPPAGDSPSIHCPGGDLLTTFSVRYFPEIPFLSLPRLSRICHHAPAAHGWRRSAAKNVHHGGDPMASNHDRTGLMGSHLPPEKGGGIRFRIVDLMASYYSSRKGNTQSSRIKPPGSG